MAKQFKCVVALLMQGIGIRTDDAEVLRSIEGAEAAGDFLFHFRAPLKIHISS